MERTAKGVVMLNDSIMKSLILLGVSFIIDSGELSFKDESKYFQEAESRLWEYVDKARKDGVGKPISISKIANDLGVSTVFVTNVLEEAGLELEELEEL